MPSDPTPEKADDGDCNCDWPMECDGMASLVCEGCGGESCICLCGGESSCFGCEACDPCEDEVEEDADE